MTEPTRRAVLTAAFLLTLIPAQRANAHHRPEHGGRKAAPATSDTGGYFDDSYFDPRYFD